MESVDDVREVHHLHVWQFDFQQMERIKDQVKDRLAGEFDIEHSTLEFECLAHETLRPEHETEMIPPHQR